jgi:hypothetical protein
MTVKPVQAQQKGDPSRKEVDRPYHHDQTIRSHLIKSDG